MLRTSIVGVWMIIFVAIPGWSAMYIVPGDFSSIQNAYSHAQNGDTIQVKPGIYHGTGWTDLMFTGKSVHIFSQKGAGETVIDGRGIQRGFSFRELPDNTMVVDGFTFMDCVGLEIGAVNFFRNSPATLKNCVIIRGRATRVYPEGEGGGIRIWGSSPIISDCIIQDCSAYQGGGFNILESSEPLIQRCVVTRCWGSGFQISTNCAPIIQDCQITDNEASPTSWSAGIGCYDRSNASIRRCLIAYNRNLETGGGGTRVEMSTPIFSNCMIIQNETSIFGGGVLCRDHAYPKFYFCTIADNTAAEKGDGFASILNSHPQFHGCILWHPFGLEFYGETGGTATVTYSDCSVEIPLEGNFSMDPLFVGAGDYHLTPESPCVDRAIDFGYEMDFDNEARPEGPGFDVGADEYMEASRLAVQLEMPSHEFHPGDPCRLDAICTNEGTLRSNIVLIVVLDALGNLYFWPSWNQSMDYDVISIPNGSTSISVLPEFEWPDETGEAAGLTFYAGLMDSNQTNLYGDIASWPFGWSAN